MTTGCNQFQHQPGCGHPTAQHGETALDLTAPTGLDLSDWEPSQIDERLADLYYRRAVATQRREAEADFLASEIARQHFRRGWNGKATREEIAGALDEWRGQDVSERPFYARSLLSSADTIRARDEEIRGLSDQMVPYEDEFQERRGWTRAFLVTNGNGHVHRDMHCSTCRPTTQYHWVTDLSGSSEEDVVEAAGERACTVCYPSAPVETLSRPTSIYSPDEQKREKARQERELAKAARSRKAVAQGLTEDGSPLEVRFTSEGDTYRHEFKTERTAVTWLVDSIVTFRGWRRGQEPDEGLMAGRQVVKDALARKHSMTAEEVDDLIEKKVAAKQKREGWY